MAINENEYTDNEVTVRKLATTIDEIWRTKIKPTFATKSEVSTGLEAKANLASPTFTGTPAAPTAAAGTKTTQIATTEFVDTAVTNGLATVADAMKFKGVVNSNSDLPDGSTEEKEYKAGWTYKVGTAGTYAGQTAEVGDVVICIKDFEEGSASDSDWSIVQSNIDGAVTGPGSAVVGNLPAFNNVNGKVISDSGVAIESKQAALDGGDLTFVTTGEKYTWNQKEVEVFNYSDVTYKQIEDARDAGKAVFIKGTLDYGGLDPDVEKPGVTYAHYSYAGQHTFPNGGGTDYFTFVMVRYTRLYYVTVDKTNAKDNSIIELSTSTLELGTGSNNAYYGDKGQIAYNHAQATHAPTDSKAAASGGTALSLVTTGEKYIWNGKQEALPTSGSSVDTYAINVSGSASESTTSESLKKLSLGSVNTLPLAEMCSSTYKAGTFYLKKTTEGGSSYVFGDVTIPNDQWYRFTTSGESASYCTITLDQCAGGSTTSFATYKILMNGGATPSQVVRVPYESTTSSVGSTTSPVYVDSYGKIQPCSGTTVSSSEKTTWNNKQNALTYADGKYAINISGNADSTTNATNAAYAFDAAPGSTLANAIKPDADVALVVYGDATYSSVKALYNAGKKLYLVTGGSIQPSGRFEYRIPLTLITFDANNEVNAFYFEYAQDDRNGASEVGSIAVYRLDSIGWTITPKQVGYATNAGHAANADAATNATNDHGGAKIRDTYLTRVDITQSAGTASDYIIGVGSIVANVDQNGFRYTTVNTYTQPVSNVYLKSMTGLTALKPDGTAFSDNLLHVQNTDTSSTYYSSGFTCIGHENPSNNLYGIGVTDVGYVEVDFDFTAYFSGYGGMKDKIDLIFALVWNNNTRFYTLPPATDTPLVPANLISTARVSVPYQTTYESYGHCHMSGLLSGADEKRLYVGVYQNMWYGSGSLADVLFQASSICVKWTRPVQGHG